MTIPGVKYDEGKPKAGLVLGDFSRALMEVSKVGTFGAEKYSEHGWLEVISAEKRYNNALMRHWLKMSSGLEMDEESNLPHMAHMAWNALAILELYLRGVEK